MTTLSWLFAGIALIGVILNIYKLRSCFWVWIVSNAGNAVYAATREAWSLAVLFSIYFVLAIWGVVKWRRRRESYQYLQESPNKTWSLEGQAWLKEHEKKLSGESDIDKHRKCRGMLYYIKYWSVLPPPSEGKEWVWNDEEEQWTEEEKDEPRV